MKNLFRSLIAAALVGLSCFSPVHAAGNLSNAYENTYIDAFRGQEFAVPTAFYVALYTSACASDSATFTEVTGGSYARKQYNPSLANWAGTQGAGTTVASSGTTGTTSNNNAITFDAATADWGIVQCFAVMSASSGGTMYFYAPLTASRNITNGSTASFAAAALTFQIDSDN